MNIVEKLNWRYATKLFDKTKKISNENINILKQAIQLAPTSYGLQLFKVLIISNEEIKKKLKPHSWDQSQITDCSHLFVFCNYTSIMDKDIDDYIIMAEKIGSLEERSLSSYGDFIKSKINEKSRTEKVSWMKSQTYIAIGFLLNACADLFIDACPMEGFEPEKYNEILNLSSQNLNAAVIVVVGYRDRDDAALNRKKVRKSFDVLFDTIH